MRDGRVKVKKSGGLTANGIIVFFCNANESSKNKNAESVIEIHLKLLFFALTVRTHQAFSSPRNQHNSSSWL
jgi:hypothetical protein